MHPIRKLRAVRAMRITELAILSGVSARAIGAAEYGIAPLNDAELALVEQALHAQIHLPPTPPRQQHHGHWRAFAVAIVCLALLGMLGLLSGELVGQPNQAPPAHAAAAQPRPTIELAATTAPTTPATATMPTAIALGQAIVARIPATPALADQSLPRGCPLLAAVDHVLVTQGYGVGTHAPSSVAGALDLAIDGDGDGYADPAATDGIVILATHAGVVHLFPNSWPGGNVVRVVNDTSGWGTLYAHLATFAVAEGQRVTLGEPIGRVGSTGMADGPHLHYEIWFRDENRDPSDIQGCWR